MLDMNTGLNNPSNEYLTTVGELNQLLVFEQFETMSVVTVVVAVWASGSTQTGLREERGRWIRRLWETTLKQMPAAHGMRLLWHTVFFAMPTDNALFIAEQFKQLLRSLYEPSLDSYCVIGALNGSAREKLQKLDEMESAVSSDRSFGQAQGFWIKLLNGEEVR
jgi:hypothetical protein